ncbi:MAG: UDP-glucose/GDP-mannose dehydrogenase family protein [Pseudomonadota bacterium]
MNITVIGVGYVGLVTAACFAEMGNRVYCIDKDADKIERLKQGEIPIYEPGLESIVRNGAAEERLIFSTDLSEGTSNSNVYFIAVGTPPNEDGSADLRHVLNVAEELGTQLDKYSIIVDKSTVPVGTADKVSDVINTVLKTRGADIEFDVVSNPEFLKEGAAVQDFMSPDRIIIGANSDRARETMRKLYAPFMRTHERLQFMAPRDAEMVKYAANAMLATKISFMNEVANLCERLGVDVENVRQGIGSDSRIGYSFIYPGCGYGGSCFPKDVKALASMANEVDFSALVLNAVQQRNDTQKHRLFEKVAYRFGQDLKGRQFALWGLAFKPNTDDMREAPSVVLLESLITAGAQIRAYDPIAMPTAQKELPANWFDNGQLELVDHQYDALNDVDALLLVTEWKPFRNPDFERMRQRMKQAVIYDGRNQYDPERMAEIGFDYTGIGRGVSEFEIG